MARIFEHLNPRPSDNILESCHRYVYIITYNINSIDLLFKRIIIVIQNVATASGAGD